ncbi:MAG: type II toxin-antitoxin system RelE family toxin [Thermoguttaceae bacterium]
MGARIRIQWTETAKESLRKLPLKVRKGLLHKADELTKGSDPRDRCKPLAGPLQGYYRIVYSRYRAIFCVKEEKLENEDTLITIRVIFIAAGIRKEMDKKDVYRIAQKLVENVLPELPGINEF